MRPFFVAVLLASLSAWGPCELVAQDETPNPRKTDARNTPRQTLEGVVKTHSKFLYKHYLQVSKQQMCALYGPDHQRGVPQLETLRPGTRIRVQGELGTYFHPGSTPDNPSPFPRTWVIYMNVQSVQVLDEPSRSN